MVARAGRIRVLGTGHSFNDMADSPGAQVTLAGLPPEVSVDSAASLARVAAGLSYAELAGRLDRLGFALRNLASLPHISVAGACATATHGSGAANQNLAAAVAGLTLVTADGDLLELTRRDEALGGAAVHLGALGVVSSLLLEVVPSFDVAQRVYEDLPLEVLDDHFADLMAAGYSVSMFTDWRAPRLTQIWIKQRLDAPSAPPVPASPVPASPVPAPPVTHEPWFTATPAPAPRHPVPGVSADACTEQLGLPGRWYERLPHFRPELRPSVGRGAAVGVPAPGGARRPRPARAQPDPRPPGPGAADLRDPCRRRGRAVAQPELPRRTAWRSTSPGSPTPPQCSRWSPWPNGSWPRSRRGRTGARSSPPRRRPSARATSACRTSSPSMRRLDPSGKFGNAYTDRYLTPSRWGTPRPGAGGKRSAAVAQVLRGAGLEVMWSKVAVQPWPVATGP